MFDDSVFIHTKDAIKRRDGTNFSFDNYLSYFRLNFYNQIWIDFCNSFLKEKKKRLYRPLSNIIYPKFNYRIATKNKLLTVLGGLLTLTVSVTGIMVMLYAYSLNGIERLTPSAIEYNVESENGQVNVTNILENGQVSLVDINLLRLNTNPEVTITESGQTIPYFDIINYSNYKELMKAQGRKNSIEGVSHYHC